MIWFILFLAAALRFIALDQSFWLDEAIGAIAARDYSYVGIVTDFLKSDNHSPLYYLALKAWASIFGFSEISLRSLSVVFGVGTVYLAFLIAKKLIKKKTDFFPLFSALFHLLLTRSKNVRHGCLFSLFSFLFVFIYPKWKDQRKSQVLADFFFLNYRPCFY